MVLAEGRRTRWAPCGLCNAFKASPKALTYQDTVLLEAGVPSLVTQLKRTAGKQASNRGS